MNGSRIVAVLILILTAWLALEARSRVAPALANEWLGWAMAAQVFMPLVIPLALAIWLWRR